MVALGHAIIAEAFSTRTIAPGVTTTDDVVWWMRQTMHDLGLLWDGAPRWLAGRQTALHLVGFG